MDILYSPESEGWRAIDFKNDGIPTFYIYV